MMETRTQEAMILEELQQGRVLTAMDALRLCGCLRLSARIFDLREKGYVIKSEFVKKGGKVVSAYSLEK